MARVLMTTLLALVTSLQAPGVTASTAPASWPEHQRLYLLGAESDHGYWSVDPQDPELGLASIVRRCGAQADAGIPGRSKPCATGSLLGDPVYSLWFNPASLFGTPPSWDAERPLRFHFELTVDTPGAYSVTLALKQGTEILESPPATEVSPGVWEGTFAEGGPLRSDPYTYLAVRVRTAHPTARLELAARGASWVELPEPEGAKGVPALLADDVYAPEGNAFATENRSFVFRDRNWSVRSFPGSTAETRTFDLSLDRHAEMLVAWVEVFDTPFVHDAVRRGQADPRKLQDWVDVRLLREGETVSFNPGGPRWGQGTAGLAAVDVAAGDLTLEVEASSGSEEAFEYDAYVLAIHGARTLGRMRWTALTDYMAITPAAMQCGTAWSAVPVTAEVTTFDVDIDWDTEAPGFPGWTPSYELPTGALVPCSEEGTGDRVRFTYPGARVWLVAATPAYDRTFVSAFDTIFEFEVRYTYTAPPVAQEA